MSPNAAGRSTVLVVDDEENVADVQALTLQDAYETRVAYGGEEAMAKYDDAVDAETLRGALDRLLDTRREGDPRLAELFSLVSKLEILESELPAGELADSEEYADVKRRARELGEELEETHPDFEEIVETFREINRGSP